MVAALATIQAWLHATNQAWGHAPIEAWGHATIHAWVQAWGYATTHAWVQPWVQAWVQPWVQPWVHAWVCKPSVTLEKELQFGLPRTHLENPVSGPSFPEVFPPTEWRIRHCSQYQHFLLLFDGFSNKRRKILEMLFKLIKLCC